MVRSYVVDDAGSAVRLVIPAGELGAGSYLVTWNGHGDAHAMWRENADGTLTLANSYTYDTWGKPATATHNTIADLGFRFLYVGEFDVQWDDAFGLGLFYMHARHYSPTLGRFLQPDPDGSETNLYAYTANNPVTELDPDGTCFILCAVVNAVVDTAIYLATTENATLEGAVGAAAVGAVTGFVGVGLLSKVAKVGSLAVKALSKVPRAGRGLSRALSGIGNRGRQAATSCARHSFAGDTLVVLADGTAVPIGTLTVGDRVLAWEEATGQTGAYPVSATWVHEDPVTGFVVIDGEAIATTPGHPFHVIGRGWVEAADLRVGDRVPAAAGGPGTVQAMSWSRGPDTMYDLTVARAHTFFVGTGGWLVHNVDPCEMLDPSSIRFSQRGISRSFFDRSKGTIDDLAHGLRSGRVRASEVPPIRVYSIGRRTVSIDNRRLAAFKMAGVAVPVRRISVRSAVRSGNVDFLYGRSSIRIRD